MQSLPLRSKIDRQIEKEIDMYSVKFIPYSYAIDSGKKGIHVLSADEYKWRVRYPETLKELKEIFNENSGLRVIWELPMGEKAGDMMVRRRRDG